MTVRSLAWMGVRTAKAAEMAAFYRDVMGLAELRDEPGDAGFRLGDGTEVHVYRDEDDDHSFFGSGPVVAFWVEDFAATYARMAAAGIRFIGSVQREGDTVWNHYVGPDGNVYEIMGREGTPIEGQTQDQSRLSDPQLNNPIDMGLNWV